MTTKPQKTTWVRPEVRSLTTADARADAPDVPIANGITSQFT